MHLIKIILVQSIFELYLYFIAGHASLKILKNPSRS